MAENTVVKEQLTDDMIGAGARLTEEIESMGLSLSASFWFFDSEINEWRLIIASPEVSSAGHTQVYEKIEQARAAIGDQASKIPLFLIRAWQPEDPLVRLLPLAIHTGPGLAPVRFTKNVIRGRYIDDLLVYRAA